MAMGENGYRRGVGVMLLNHKGEVFVGARIDNTDEAWQMPQGGIDKGEEPWGTALRELEEETGIPPHLVERIAECSERMKYDLPDELQGKLWGGKWKGQDQDWFLARFRTRSSIEGFLEEDGEIWSRDGRLLVQSRQLSLVMAVPG